MRATECDVCGSLVPAKGTVQLVVSLINTLNDEGEAESTEWQKVDVCLECLRRKSAVDLLERACSGFAEARTALDADLDADTGTAEG